MGASTVSQRELQSLRIEIVESARSGSRCLRIPAASLPAYRDLVRERLEPGFWNEVLGREEISFTFKLKDGTLKELTYSPENRQEIAQLCSELNDDPIEKTSDLPRYLATNSFYRDLMIAYYDVVDSC